MEYQQNHYHQYQHQHQYPYQQYYSRFPPARTRAPPVRWVKQWIPQELAAAGGKCSLFRWVREDMVQVLKDQERARELEAAPKPEPTTEILFLCSYENCGKTFTDVSALRKHSNVHGERQHVCNYPGCGKKFADSSKLKRHYLVHTGDRDFVCPYEGCGKAFSLDFNLRAHMKTHQLENYHVCPYQECGKRYTNELKLMSHIKAYHEKSTPTAAAAAKRTPPPQIIASKSPPPSVVYVGPSTPARPFECPYEGCTKAYIHEYKLNLHLKREHLEHTNEYKFMASNGEGRSKEKSKGSLVGYKLAGKAIDVNQRISELGFGSGGRRRGSLGNGKEVRMYGEEEEMGDEGGEDSEETEDGDGNNGPIRWGYKDGRRNGDYDDQTDDED